MPMHLIAVASSNLGEERKLSLIKFLITKGAEVNVKDDNNLSALDYLRKIEQNNIKNNYTEERIKPIREAILVLIEAGAKE